MTGKLNEIISPKKSRLLELLCFCFGVLVLLCAAPTADAEVLKLNGSMIVSYSDRQGGVGLRNNEGNNTIKMSQFSMSLSKELSEFTKLATRFSTSGRSLNVTEGYLRFSGLPQDGVVTIGQFYKPLGAPIQTAGLSYPALMFHSAAVQGVKAGFEFYPLRWELGFVNNNPLASNASSISASSAFGRPLPSATTPLNTNSKEGYAFFGWRDGGIWGSLDLNIGFTYGQLSQTDRTTIDNLGIFTDLVSHKNRRVFDAAADYMKGPFRIYGEYVKAHEGNLTIVTYNIGTAYRIGKVNWIAGYDLVKNNTEFRNLDVPAAWHRRRLSFGVTVEASSRLQLRGFYEQNWENIDGGSDFDNLEKGIPNDAVILQAVLSM
ncbi:MAG: hypothetical protein JKX97_02240 [Candidatus Lindowbacteria bacterium]|nr:hypothetical protein [Candidatus Lindowbacteria bacterium]